ncbi:MAG: DUF4250 domain-containing protein [Lachnospiraceae bacterium]|nr:DUF4250 domain-containing protein [Lachnospiraceae bacterium]
MLPKDPNMLLSYINTGIRDKYSDFYDMADSEGFDGTEVMEKLEKAGYSYDEQANRFINKR